MEPATELVILVGLPASGKSTFYRTRLGLTHEHVSKDLLRTVRDRHRRQRELLEGALRQGRSAAVDNINATAAERALLIGIGRAHRVRVAGYYFDATARECLERNRRRQGRDRVPDVAIHTAAKKLEIPTYAEGFDGLYRVRIGGPSEFEVTPAG